MENRNALITIQKHIDKIEKEIRRLGSMKVRQFNALFGLAGSGHVIIGVGGIQIMQSTAVMGEWQTDGDIFIGSNIASPASTYFSILAQAQTYNGEAFSAGDMLIGDNSALKANIFWDKSAGRLNFRGGTTTKAYIDTDGTFVATGANISGTITATTGTIGGWTIGSTEIRNSGSTVILRGAGNLAFGATPPTSASVGTGLFMDSTGLYGLASSVQQIIFSAVTGKITAGNNTVTMDASGIAILTTSSASSEGSIDTPNNIMWNYSPYKSFNIYSWYDASAGYIYGNIISRANADETSARIQIITRNYSTTHNASIALLSPESSNGIITMASDNIILTSTSGVYLNDTTNTNSTNGLTINQGNAGDEIFSLKSSLIDHPYSNNTEADTYFGITKFITGVGGSVLSGFTETYVGMNIKAYIVNTSTNKTTAASAPILLDSIYSGGTTPGVPQVLGSTNNLLVIRDYTTARFAFDAAGTLHHIPDSDTNINLLTVQVTDTPTISWNETADTFQFNKGILCTYKLTAGGNILSANSSPQLDVNSLTGGILSISSRDASLVANDLIGKIIFWSNDTQLTTKNIGASIELYATNTVSTDAPQSYMTFNVSGSSTGTDPLEHIKFAPTTVPKIGFFGATPVVKPTALTTALTTITPPAYSADYTIQAMISVTVPGGTLWGFKAENEGNTVINVIKNLQDRVNDLESKLQGLGLLT